MAEFYFEIREKETALNKFKPLAIIRKYVQDEKEAEVLCNGVIDEFDNPVAVFVEMKHDPDPAKNLSCISKEIKDGKVVA